MGWLWLVGSLQIKVSFAEYSLFYRVLLQKRPMFLGSLLIVATLYQQAMSLESLCGIQLSDKWVMSHICTRHVAYIWISHITHMDESCLWIIFCKILLANKWVMLHIWMSHVAYTWLSHVTDINQSCLWNIFTGSCSPTNLSCHPATPCNTLQYTLTHFNTIFVGSCSPTNESCHKCEWVMSHFWISHVSGTCLS